MLPAHFIHKLLVLLPVTHPKQTGPVNNVANSGPYDYSDPNGQWGSVNSQCLGTRQSPIDLSTTTSIIAPSLPPFKFGNFEVPLAQPIIVQNTGLLVQVNFPLTQNGQPAFVTGGVLKNDVYEALYMTFNWGSPTTLGSEHALDGRRFDMEMKIYFRNNRYSITEASRYADGLIGLVFFIRIVENPDRFYPGLEKIYETLPQIVASGSSATLDGTLTIAQLLGDVDYKEFFVYPGSLPFPPCSEAGLGIVFPQPLQISRANANNFFSLRSGEAPLLNNFRPLQPLNGRNVYYRASSGKLKIN